MKLQDQEDIQPVETTVKSILILGEAMLSLWWLLFYDEGTENFKENFSNMNDIFSTKIWFTRGRGKLMGE